MSDDSGYWAELKDTLRGVIDVKDAYHTEPLERTER